MAILFNPGAKIWRLSDQPRLRSHWFKLLVYS